MPSHGSVWDLFIGKYLYYCQNFNDMIELFHMNINSDTASLSKVDVQKN